MTSEQPPSRTRFYLDNIQRDVAEAALALQQAYFLL